MAESPQRCHEIITSTSIQKVVGRYQELILDNDKKEEFYDGIQKVWQSINEEGGLLKGKCDDCPRKSILNWF